MLGVEELFDLDRILLTYIFQIQVPAVLVPRSPVKMEESAKMGMTEDTIVLAEVDSLERTVRMVSHNLNFLKSCNMYITCHWTVLLMPSIYANSPGYDTSLPVSRTGHHISRVKSSFELFCALV